MQRTQSVLRPHLRRSLGSYSGRFKIGTSKLILIHMALHLL